MWKAMLECHHAQHITISLAYHTKSLPASQRSEPCKQAIARLQNEMECFASSFANWVGAQKSYVEALNAWLHKCILHPPQERSWRRRMPFSPRRALAPPVFVLSADWLAGLNALPSKEVMDSLQGFVSDLHGFTEQQKEEKLAEPNSEQQRQENTEEKCEGESSYARLQVSLTRLFDQLAKYAEAAARVYEDVKQGTEQAMEAYINGVRFRFQQQGRSDALPL